MLLLGFCSSGWVGCWKQKNLNHVAGSVLYLFQVPKVSGYWLYILIDAPVVMVILSSASRYADLQLTFPMLTSVVEGVSLVLIHQGTNRCLANII